MYMCFYNARETQRHRDSYPGAYERENEGATTQQESTRITDQPKQTEEACRVAAESKNPRCTVRDDHEGKARATVSQAGDTCEDGWTGATENIFRCPREQTQMCTVL